MSEWCAIVRSQSNLSITWFNDLGSASASADDSGYSSAAAYIAALNSVIPVSAALRDNTTSLGNALFMAKGDGARIRISLVK